jgi:hypothetical protein
VSSGRAKPEYLRFKNNFKRFDILPVPCQQKVFHVLENKGKQAAEPQPSKLSERLLGLTPERRREGRKRDKTENRAEKKFVPLSGRIGI